jgi:hypothetical protein
MNSYSERSGVPRAKIEALRIATAKTVTGAAMAQQTFKDFLARGLPFGNVVDPFVYDALRDSDFPDAGSWEQIEGYIKQRRSDISPEAFKAAQSLWQLYVEGR